MRKEIAEYTRQSVIKVMTGRSWITYNELVATAFINYRCYGDVGRALRKMREEGYKVKERPHTINGVRTGCKEFMLSL